MAEVQPEQSNQREQPSSTTPFWEWVVGWIGVVLVVGVVGFLLYQATQPSSPPDILLQPEQVLSQTGGYLVKVRATNQGGDTAADVLVEGVLLPTDDPNGEPIETSEVTFDYLPPHSSRQGGIFFQENPDDYQLEIRVKGYIEP